MDQNPDQDPETQGSDLPELIPSQDILPEVEAADVVTEPVAAEPSSANSIPTAEDQSPSNEQNAPSPANLTPSTEQDKTTPHAPAAADNPKVISSSATPAPAKHKHSLAKKSKHHSSAPINYVRRPILLVIIMIFLILAILAGAGLAAWYFLCYNRPENVAFDAINNFLHEPSVVVHGAVQTQYENNSVTLDLHADTYNLTGSSKATLSISSLDANGSAIYDQPYQVEIGSVLMSDGALYLRLDELSNALDQYFEDHALSPDGVDLFTAFVYESAKAIDGQWWQISIPDIINLYSDSPAKAQPAKELYACIVNVLDGDIKGELADIYRDHQFINISRITHPSNYSKAVADGFNNLYEVKFDYDKMADFVNALRSSSVANSIYNCLNHYYDSEGSSKHIAATDSEPVGADSLKQKLSGLQKAELEISNFTHQLAGINISISEDDLISLAFEYQPVTITPPHRYHRFSELVEELGETLLDPAESLYDSLQYNPITNEWEIIEDESVINNEIETT